MTREVIAKYRKAHLAKSGKAWEGKQHPWLPHRVGRLDITKGIATSGWHVSRGIPEVNEQFIHKMLNRPGSADQDLFGFNWITEWAFKNTGILQLKPQIPWILKNYETRWLLRDCLILSLHYHVTLSNTTSKASLSKGHWANICNICSSLDLPCPGLIILLRQMTCLFWSPCLLLYDGRN